MLPSITFFVSLLTFTSAFPFPSFSHYHEIDNQPSVLPRQAATSPVPPPPPPAPAVTITGDIPPIVCATPGRTQNWSTDQIKGVMTSLATFVIQNQQDPQNTLGSPSAGIDPAIPPTFAVGCDTTKTMFWSPMIEKDLTDIVVMNVDTGSGTAAFCGVMTNADEAPDQKGRYHICNKQ
ncbi:MAG: hypothetical protein Q9225_002426 [Loekoesia sp. 1 TL-2023]